MSVRRSIASRWGMSGGRMAATIALATLFASALSAAAVFGSALAKTGYFEDPPNWLAFWGLLVLFLAAYLALARLTNLIWCRLRENARKTPKEEVGGPRHARNGKAHPRAQRALDLIVPSPTCRSVVAHALVMLVLWQGYYLALFPGPMNWDTYYQITQCYPGQYPVFVIPWGETQSFTDAWFSDHHPLFDTLLFGAFARVSDKLFGTWNYGVFAFVELQGLISALVFSWSCAYLRKIQAPLPLACAAFVFLCFMPFIPIYAATMLKDSLFAPLFVVYFIMVAECVRTQGASLAQGGRRIAAFVALGVLLALTKKPGLYIVVASAVILALVLRPACKAFIAQAVATLLVMMVVLPMLVFPLAHAIPGGRQETLGPLLQQTARCAAMYPSDASAQEKAAIDKVLPYDELATRYNPFNSDPVKFQYRYDTCTASDLTAYLATWAAQGLRHPDAYLQATLVTTAPYVNLDGIVLVHENTADTEHGGGPELYEPQSLKPLHDFVISAYHSLCDAPLVGLLFRTGIYSYLIPTLAFLALFMRKSPLSPSFVPIFLSLFVCVITPCFHARYALPLIYLAPMIACMPFAILKPGEKDASIA